MSAPDVRIIDQGTVVGFAPISAEAREWFNEHVDAPAYACAGRHIIWADHRPAQNIIDALCGAGFALEGA